MSVVAGRPRYAYLLLWIGGVSSSLAALGWLSFLFAERRRRGRGDEEVTPPHVTVGGGSTLVLRRPRPMGPRRDILSSYRVIVDEQTCRLREGEEVALSVAPGIHKVRAAYAWTSTPELKVRVAAGRTAWIQVRPGEGLAAALYQLLFDRRAYLLLEELTEDT